MCDTLHSMTQLDDIEIARVIECENTEELMKQVHVKKSDFTIVSQNIRSIYCNFNDFMLTLTSFTFKTDVIVLTECRLNSSKPLPLLENYDAYFTTNQQNQNDGVVIYVKNTLMHKVNEIQLSQASCLQLEVLNNTVLCIYRSPSFTNVESFIDSLKLHLETISNDSIIITGDININIKSKSVESLHEYKNKSSYLNMLSTFGLLAGHTKPTREKNCLDHVMLKINKIKYSPTIAIIKTSTTDHFTTFLSQNKIKNMPIINKTKTTTNFKNTLEYLQNKNLSNLMFCQDPNSVTDCLVDILIESIKANTITTTIPSTKRIIKPWISPGILRCIRNRNKLQIKARKNPYDEIAKITYNRYRNFCNKLIKKLKRKYERELIENSINNNKLLWKNIKGLTYTNKSNTVHNELLNIKSTSVASANFINNYFANIGKELAHKIPHSNQNAPNVFLENIPVQSNSFALSPASQDEVHTILMNLKTSSAPGWDNIPTRFLKFAAKEIVPIITHIANLSFNQGIFPNSLKQSLITPVYKSGDRDDVNNYRPISVLSSLSKILEKLLNNRLRSYLTKYNLLSSVQFGFRNRTSTEEAIYALTSLVVDTLDHNDKCLAVFLDLKKAFDTVSLPILVQKLEKKRSKGYSPLTFSKLPDRQKTTS